ncbi:MAG: hypothetical protein GX814_04430 [Microbacteriaceae bacterium]|nr:hypothetical protein [Microbacteriaceae bacterium]
MNRSDDPVRASGESRSNRKQLLLRLDPAVHAAVAKWAADDLRSVNAQIEVILRRALADAGREVRAAPLRPRGRPRIADASASDTSHSPGATPS